MNFNDLHILVEGFKEKRDLWIKQGGDPQIVDMVINHFKTLKLRNILPKDKIDIDKYQSFNELWQTVTEYEQKKSRSQIEKEQKVKGSKKVFENDEWSIYYIFTYEASKLLGKGTTWCISSNYTRFHFDSYGSRNNIYFCINKKTPGHKVALLMGNRFDEYAAYNETDKLIPVPISLKVIMLSNPDVFKIFDYSNNIEKYVHGQLTKNADGSYDVDGDFILQDLVEGMEKLPWKFGNVSGNFNVNGIGLRTLEGCPKHCSIFSCVDNNITSLVGGPTTVDIKYDCSNNGIRSLEGFPEFLFDNNTFINVSNNQLKTLEGANFPEDVNYFYCHGNDLTNLIEGPTGYVDQYKCSFNKLNTLKGAPKECTNFSCLKNQLNNVDYAPRFKKSSIRSLTVAFDGWANPYHSKLDSFSELKRLGWHNILLESGLI